jgi:small subunit ribosomal protein S17
VSHLKELKIPQRSPRKVGIVESDARDKTRKVSIRFSVRHPKYGKYIRRRTLLQVHDEENVSRVGDRVEIAECRPVSKTKSWVLLQVLKSGAAGVAVTPTDAQPQEK